MNISQRESIVQRNTACQELYWSHACIVACSIKSFSCTHGNYSTVLQSCVPVYRSSVDFPSRKKRNYKNEVYSLHCTTVFVNFVRCITKVNNMYSLKSLVQRICFSRRHCVTLYMLKVPDKVNVAGKAHVYQRKLI